MTEDRYEAMYQAATMYYLQEETMESIARQLGLSRSSVSRLLKEARVTGLVRISIAERGGSRSPLAHQLAATFGVRVHLARVRSSASAGTRFEQVARLAGGLITDIVDDGAVIGLAWGETVSHVVRHLGRRPLRDVTVVQLNGGANQRSTGIPYIGSLLGAFTDAFGAESVLLPVPAFFDDPATKEAVWRERATCRALEWQSRVTLAVFGVGCFTGAIPSHVYSGGYLDAAEIAELTADGVVGDVCTVLIREDGSWADIVDNARATGLTPTELANVPQRICVVADPTRANAVIGALRAGVATDLVIDETSARAVLHRALGKESV